MEAAVAEMPTLTDHEKVTATRLEGKFTAMVVSWLLGIGCLFSWNSMLTIEDYYVILFPNYHPTRVLTLVYQPFALGTLAILTYHEANINTRKRNLFGYFLLFLGTLGVLLLDLATSGKGGIGGFIGVCVMSAAFGVGDAHAQGGMIGDLSFMLPELVQSFVAGLAASGAITCGLRAFTKSVFDNSRSGLRKGALLFLTLCAIFELLCVILYASVLQKLPIVKYYRSKAASEGSKTVTSDLVAAGIYSHFEEGPEQNALGNILVLFLMGGLFAGVTSDWLWLIGKDR